MARLIPSQRCGQKVNRFAKLYSTTHASASGLSSAQSGLSDHAAKTNSADAITTEIHACGSESVPFGSSRFIVRGLRASKARSAILLNPIATHRAAEKASTAQSTVRQPTGATRDAASTPSSANGSAKSV